MQGLTQPELLLKPFCSSGNKNTLPDVNTDALNPQKADLTNGFPAITEGSPDDGKIPPERKDFNGLGYLTTSYDFFYQAGGTFTFSSTIATAIGGYPKGAKLWYKNADGVCMILESAKENNSDNFLLDNSYIGDSWKVVSFMGIDNSNIKLLDFVFRDREVHDMAWVLSDGSWLDGSVYAGAYNHLIDDIGYRAVELLNTKNIYVNATNAGFSGYCVRRSALDKTVDGTTYYAWNTSSSDSYDKTIYLTLNVDSMTTEDAIDAMQGQRIYTTADGTAFSASVNKIMVNSTDTYTINGSEVVLDVKIGSDGHKVVLVTDDEDATVSSIFNATGVAWYYVLDRDNSRFKLPRTIYSFDGARGNVGGYIEAGLPDFGGQLGSINGHGFVANGIFKQTSAYVTNPGGGTGDWRNVEAKGSYSNEIYGKSNTVQPPATECYLYFYVGGFNDDAISQTAGLNASLFMDKMSKDGSDSTSVALSNILTSASSSSLSDMVSLVMPDYSSGITVSGTFTPTTNGVLAFVYMETSGVTIKDGDERVYYHAWGGGDYGTQYSQAYVWVKKGVTLTGVPSSRFYPCFGG